MHFHPCDHDHAWSFGVFFADDDTLNTSRYKFTGWF